MLSLTGSALRSRGDRSGDSFSRLDATARGRQCRGHQPRIPGFLTACLISETGLLEGRSSTSIPRLPDHSPGLVRREVQVKLIRRKSSKMQDTPKAGLRVNPDTFFFYEKRTGVAHFRVEAGPDGRLPAEQAAGLLAMHCLVRGQSPSDYTVMVEAGEILLDNITEKAEKLLEAGRSVPAPVSLSRREEEVLSGIMRSMANKEIAVVLHLSERTVKFHVSSLLAKFRVRGRMELVREASRAYLPSRHAAVPEPMAFPSMNRELRPYTPLADGFGPKTRTAEVVPLTKRQLIASA